MEWLDWFIKRTQYGFLIKTEQDMFILKDIHFRSLMKYEHQMLYWICQYLKSRDLSEEFIQEFILQFYHSKVENFNRTKKYIESLGNANTMGD